MNINKVILIGNLTQNVDYRVLNNGQSVAKLTLATNRVFTDKSGEKREETEYHSVIAWGKLAELCNKFLEKGRMIYVEGRLKTRTYENAQGQKVSKTEIIAEVIKFGPKPKEKENTEKELEEIDFIEPESENFDISDFAF
jgi:single-strand DNA-binding protein